MTIKFRSDPLYNALRKDIRSGLIEPGKRLIEVHLARRFHAPRSKIRDVLKKLELNGMVRISPHKGAIVIQPSIRDIQTCYELQSVLEGLACFLSTPKLTEKDIKKLIKTNQEMEKIVDGRITEWQKLNICFHRLFIERSGNERIDKIIHELDQFARYWHIMLSIQGTRNKGIQEHKKIIDAVKKRDPNLAKKFMEEHILRASNELITILNSLPRH